MTSNISPLSVARALPHLLEAESVLALNCDGLLGPSETTTKARVSHGTFAALDGNMLALTSPDLVIMPLFTADQDATAMIERLMALGYQGKVAVLAPTLPKPRLVERELRSLGLQVTLISP